MVEHDKVAQRVGAELAEPRFAGGADNRIGQTALVVDERIDLLFDSAFADQLVHEDGARLADAPGAVGGLVFDGRVPPAVVVHDLAGSREVEAGAARFQRDQQ